MDDVERCPVCNWPLDDDPAGCRRGDCSMRPMPKTPCNVCGIALRDRAEFDMGMCLRCAHEHVDQGRDA